MASNTSFRDSALRAISIIGLVAILVLGAWGIIQLVFGFSDFFSRFGFSSNTASSTSNLTTEQIVVTSPTNVSSDQAFPIAWKHTGGSSNYAYVVSYACAEGLSFAAPVPTGEMRVVPCNVPFNFTNATNNMQLIPVLHTGKPATTSVTVTAVRLDNNTTAAKSSSSIITVASGTATAQNTTTTTTKPTTTKPVTTTKPTTTRTTTTYTSSGHTSNLYGSADLKVSILSITPDASGRYVAQFVISNVGTNVASRGWNFYAELPLNPPYTFVSQGQQALYPGDKIVYTLGFDSPVTYGYGMGYGGNTFSVTVDPQGLVRDANHTNNTASATFNY